MMASYRDDSHGRTALTKAMQREIASLAEAKGRRKSGAFVAEGTKCVLDTLGHFRLRHLIATKAWIDANLRDASLYDKIITANRGEIGAMSSMVLAPDVLAVYDLPSTSSFDPAVLKGRLVLALDRVQDPGNMGTIIRTADWMGVSHILASNDTVDCFNPKVIQATMGAIARVEVVYGDLPDMLGRLSGEMPIAGTFLDGKNIYSVDLPKSAVVVMGNEGKGISTEVEHCVTERLLIPSYPADRPTSESLNVAVATAIVLSQFRSGQMK